MMLHDHRKATPTLGAFVHWIDFINIIVMLCRVITCLCTRNQESPILSVFVPGGLVLSGGETVFLS